MRMVLAGGFSIRVPLAIVVLTVAASWTSPAVADHAAAAEPVFEGPLAPSRCEHAIVHPRAGCQEWRASIAGSLEEDGVARVFPTPDGVGLIVYGAAQTPTGGHDLRLVAFDAATGSERWRFERGAPGGYVALGDATVSPDGSIVYAVVSPVEALLADGYHYDYGLLVLALDAASGSVLWSDLRYAPNYPMELAQGIAVSPDGSKLVVTATEWSGDPFDNGGLTVAYDTRTGATLWSDRETGAGDLMPVNALARDDGSATVALTYGTAWVLLRAHAADGSRLSDVTAAGIGGLRGQLRGLEGGDVLSVMGGGWDPGNAARIDPTTGAIRWRMDSYGIGSGLGDHPNAVVSADGATLVLVEWDGGADWPGPGRARVVDVATGSTRWTYADETGSLVGAYADADGILLTGRVTGERVHVDDPMHATDLWDPADTLVVAFDSAGERLWRAVADSGDRDDDEGRHPIRVGDFAIGIGRNLRGLYLSAHRAT